MGNKKMNMKVVGLVMVKLKCCLGIHNFVGERMLSKAGFGLVVVGPVVVVVVEVDCSSLGLHSHMGLKNWRMG